MWGNFRYLGIVLFVLFSMSASANDLLVNSDLIHNEIQNPNVFNVETCPEYIANRMDSIGAWPSNLNNSGQDAVTTIFDIRVILKSKLTEFYQSKTLTPECVTAVRRAMRVARTTEEMILVQQMKSNALPQTNSTKYSNGTLQGGYPQTFKNPKFYAENQELELKSGDLILMRGSAVVSALIAHIGDDDGMFSHVGVFYVDPKTQKKFIIESLIETGLKITPYEEWMKIVEVRVAVYRYADESVAALAAESLYNYFLEYKEKHRNKTVPYDFSMNLESYDKMFCSEVAALGYDLASEGKIKLPAFVTSANHIRDSNFLNQIGVKTSNIFSPNDLEIEPSFEFVGEFRRIDRLLVLRTQDLAMQAMFDWMQSYGYKLKVSFFGTIKNKFGKILDDIGLKDFGIPRGMPAKTIQVMSMLRVLQKDILTAQLDTFEKRFETENGRLPSHAEMLSELESFRRADCQNFKSKKTTKGEVLFHNFFSSDRLACD